MNLEIYTKEEIIEMLQQQLGPLHKKLALLEKSANKSLTGLVSTRTLSKDLGIDRSTLMSWRDNYGLKAYNPSGKGLFWEIDEVVRFIKTNEG